MANMNEFTRNVEVVKHFKVILIAIQIFSFVRFGIGHPMPAKTITMMHVQTAELNHAVDKTICPFDVIIDRNESRWPEEIKHITCRKEYTHNCHQNRCQCTQLYHDIVVQPKDGNSESWKISNNIGCVCLMEKSSAPIIPSPLEIV